MRPPGLAWGACGAVPFARLPQAHRSSSIHPLIEKSATTCGTPGAQCKAEATSLVRTLYSD